RVGGSTNAMVHLATHDYVKLYPLKYARVLKPRPRDADWWIVDVSEPRFRQYLVQDNDSPLRARPPFDLWLVDDAVLVFADDLPRPRRPSGAVFGAALALERYDVTPADAGVPVRLAWRVL